MKINFLGLGLAAALMLPVAMIPRHAFARSQGSNMQKPAPDEQQGNLETQEAKTFNGTIIKQNDLLMLQDPIAKVRYQLDNQDKARPFAGKQVKVTGKLELNTNLIHVNEIQPIR